MSKKDLENVTKDINQLARICLDIANLCDRDAEENGIRNHFAEKLHMGYRALSSYIRKGVIAIVKLQDEYSSAIEKAELAKFSETSARKFLEDVFGDEDVDSINDKDKERIREFVRKIYAEWEQEEE